MLPRADYNVYLSSILCGTGVSIDMFGDHSVLISLDI